MTENDLKTLLNVSMPAARARVQASLFRDRLGESHPVTERVSKIADDRRAALAQEIKKRGTPERARVVELLGKIASPPVEFDDAVKAVALSLLLESAAPAI